MSWDYNVGSFNQHGKAELSQIKDMESNESSKPSKFQIIRALPKYFVGHLFRSIEDIPIFLYKFASFIRTRNEESFDLLKRQTWNTFVAHPIELAVELIALPVIDIVAYRSLCLKIDYDFYLTEAEQTEPKKMSENRTIPEKPSENDNKVNVEPERATVQKEETEDRAIVGEASTNDIEVIVNKEKPIQIEDVKRKITIQDQERNEHKVSKFRDPDKVLIVTDPDLENEKEVKLLLELICEQLDPSPRISLVTFKQKDQEKVFGRADVLHTWEMIKDRKAVDEMLKWLLKKAKE